MKEKLKQRIASVKEIFKQLKADYYYDINTIRSIFNLYSDSEMEESNVIVGKIEDHDYCFIEYYHVGTGRNNHSHWNTNLYMKTKNNNFPNFHLKTKSSTTSLAVLLIILASIFFISSIVLLGTMLFGKVEGANMFNLFGVIISLFFLVVSSIILIININTLKNTYNRIHTVF